MKGLKPTLVSAIAIGLLAGSVVGVAAQDDAATEPSSQTTELLPGVDLVTEEVEPGVYRVVSDGVRELARPADLLSLRYFDEYISPGFAYRIDARETGGIVANADAVWLRRPEGIIRLGESEPVWAPEAGDSTPSFIAGPDGTLYQTKTRNVLRDGSWEKVGFPAGRLGLQKVSHFLVAPDGSLWVIGNNGEGGKERRRRLARRDADGWSRVKNPPVSPGSSGQASDWGVSGDGDLYVKQGQNIKRFDGTRWETLESPGKDIYGLDVGRDGAVWVSVTGADRDRMNRLLLRAGADGWITHDPGRRYLRLAENAVGDDGALWYAATGDPMISGGCDGVTRTDGTTTTTFLPGLCIYDIAIGPEGDVWLETSSWDGDYFVPESVGPLEVHVITQEAVEAAVQ